MKKISVNEISHALNNECKIIGNVSNAFFTNAKSIDTALEDSLVWISSKREDKKQLLKNTRSKIIICDEFLDLEEVLSSKCFVIVKNPRLSFIRVIDKLFFKKPDYGIHPTAFIHPEAKISKNSFIGAFSYIGNSQVGEGSVIYGNCYIYDNIIVGKNVTIHAGTIIGADGFGYERNEKNELQKFPHIGGVIIEDNVEIGSNTSIDRGTLGNTIIKFGAKIDNLVHIAHNVIIGKHTAIIAHAMIGGSTKIDDYSWIAPAANIRDSLQIGKNVTVGLGATVTKSIPDNQIWTGNPARPLEEFLIQQKKIKEL